MQINRLNEFVCIHVVYHLFGYTVVMFINTGCYFCMDILVVFRSTPQHLIQASHRCFIYRERNKYSSSNCFSLYNLSQTVARRFYLNCQLAITKSALLSPFKITKHLHTYIFRLIQDLSIDLNKMNIMIAQCIKYVSRDWKC